jgi:hypothetical protein
MREWFAGFSYRFAALDAARGRRVPGSPPPRISLHIYHVVIH